MRIFLIFGLMIGLFALGSLDQSKTIRKLRNQIEFMKKIEMMNSQHYIQHNKLLEENLTICLDKLNGR